jgi:hypothetical protein
MPVQVNYISNNLNTEVDNYLFINNASFSDFNNSQLLLINFNFNF